MSKVNVKAIAEALGASKHERLSPETLKGPFDWLSMAEKVRKTLQTSGGRPTDPNRTLTRQVRFTEAHWQALESLAKEWSTENRTVSPAQVAAMLIEQGLKQLQQTKT